MPAAVVMSGELGLIGLFDLGQLLMLNGATGELCIQRQGRRGYLYFDRGQIVNAVDDEYHEGEGAAFKLFSWKDGTYEFRPEPPSGSRAISDSTEGLMMEAARRMDEAGASTGDAVDKLTRRAGALDALREAFQSVAEESVAVPEADHEAGGSPFALLRDASDALLFRPGHVPRVQQAGRWRNAGTQALDPAAFDQLRARLLEGVWPAGGSSARTNGVQTCVVAHDDQRRYVVTRVGGAHEALWVRAAGLAPPDAASLDGDLSVLHSVLASRGGLVIVGGPDAESADRLFHACVAERGRGRSATVLLVADHGRWKHAEETGALVCTSAAEAPDLLRTLAPDACAFDTAHAEASLAALHSASLVIVAVVAADPDALLARWCARVGRRWGDGIEALLASGSLGLVHTRGTRRANGRVPFLVRHGSVDADLSGAPLNVNEDDTAAETAEPANPVATSPAPEAAVAPPSPSDTAKPPHPDGKPSDPMAALAAELGRTLRKAA